jgi:hypothetical protein
MNLSISSAFDGGNIRLVAIEGSRVDLEIVNDHQSEFYQWFYFRLTGAAGTPVELRLLNCAGSAYPHGWPGYRACMSYDREYWQRLPETSYQDGSSPSGSRRPATMPGSPISPPTRWNGTTIWWRKPPRMRTWNIARWGRRWTGRSWII